MKEKQLFKFHAHEHLKQIQISCETCLQPFPLFFRMQNNRNAKKIRLSFGNKNETKRNQNQIKKNTYKTIPRKMMLHITRDVYFVRATERTNKSSLFVMADFNLNGHPINVAIFAKCENDIHNTLMHP